MMCEALTSNHLHTRYAGSFYIFSYKTLSEGYKQHYYRSAKGILSKPTRRFPHTKVIYHLSITCNRGNKTLSTQLYSARLTRQEERKDSNDMQGYLTCEFIAFAGSITKCASLHSIFINSRIVSLTNHSM